MTALALDPVTPGTLYVGTNSEGVFKSVDGGGKWSHLTNGLKRATVWNLTIDPGCPETIYAGTHEGFYKSVNAGALWSPGNRGLTSFNVLALVADPKASGTLYVGTAAGIFQSLDAGGNWRPVAPDLYATAMAMDPAATSTLYAGTHLGVIKSTDSGARWMPLRLAARPQAEVHTRASPVAPVVGETLAAPR